MALFPQGVDDAKDVVGPHQEQVQRVHPDQFPVDRDVAELANDAAEVAEEDEGQENETLALGGLGAPSLEDGKGPAGPKGYHHDDFKDGLGVEVAHGRSLAQG